MKTEKFYRIVRYTQQMSASVMKDDTPRMTGLNNIDVDISFKCIEDCHHVAQMAGVSAYTVITTDDDDRWSWSSRENEVFVSQLLKAWRDELSRNHKLGVERAHEAAKFIAKLPEEKIIFEDDTIQYVAVKLVRGDDKDRLNRGYQPTLEYTCVIRITKKAMFNKNSTNNCLGNASSYRQWRGSSRVNGKLVDSHYIILGAKLCNDYRSRTEDTDKWVRPSRGWRRVPAEKKPELQKKLVRQFEFAYEAFLNYSRARHDDLNELNK